MHLSVSLGALNEHLHKVRDYGDARLHGDRTAVSVEVYRICEHGRRPSDSELRRMFTIDG
jgi:hypothetical protein